MINFKTALHDIRNSVLEPWMESLEKELSKTFESYTHGELSGWKTMLEALPKTEIAELELQKEVKVTSKKELSDGLKRSIIEQLMLLHPWRKGPFHIHGIHLDTEWRSDWKWQRIEPHLDSLDNQTILDVGCGNGYHLFRMKGAGARLCIGIDPSQKFLAQFLAIKHFLGNMPVHHLPLGIESMPQNMPLFDKVFSMGVLYHRRSPIEHIIHLKNLTRKGGQIILETLVVDGDNTTVLIPEGRYAQMRNVWFLPSVSALTTWMKRCDLQNIKVADCSTTTLEEQRSTKWMHFHSLENYLDPEDHTKTIEGYPAPVRATIIATV